MIWVDKPKKNLKNKVYLSTFTNLKWYPTVMQTPLLCIETNILLYEWLFDANVLLIGHVVAQN